MPAGQNQILILGETPLVEEFTKCCTGSGYAVHSIVNTNVRGRSKRVKLATPFSKSLIAAFELTNTDPLCKKQNLQFIQSVVDSNCLIFSSAITVTCEEQSRWLKKSERLIGISALPALPESKLIELSSTAKVPPEIIKNAQNILASLGKETSLVQDRIGMVLPRILCMIINEAYYACMDEIALPQEIDLAMKLGTHYPSGPLEWSRSITLQQVVAVLDALYDDLGDSRYRVAPLLRKLSY